MGRNFRQNGYEQTIGKYWPSLWRQNNIDGQLHLFSRNCKISRFNFTETKFLIPLIQQDFPIGYIANMLDHMTRSRDQTGYKHPLFNHNFDEPDPVRLLNYPT